MSYEPTVWVDGDHVTSAKLNKLEQGVNSMSYTPTVWNAGDVVTAEKLNKLEQGVAEGGGGGATFPTFTKDGGSWSCDMTYAEAKANYEANALGGEDGYNSVCYIIYESKTKYWAYLSLVTGESLEFFDIPEGITEGLSFGEQCIFASDGNYYGTKD